MSKQNLRRIWAALCISCLITSCGIEVASNVETPSDVRPLGPAEPTGTSRQPTTQRSTNNESVPPGFYLIDKLERSAQLDGIDMHLRYAERTATDLTVYVSFYNNRSEDLAYVSGAEVNASRLVGVDTYTPSNHSSSLASGIDPEGGWLSGGATAGSLTFAGVEGSAFAFEFPGFPAVEFALDQPIRENLQPAPPQIGDYTYDLEVTSSRLGDIALRIERVRVEEDALLLSIAFVNRTNNDITFTSTVTGDDAVLFDGLWQQYRPGEVTPSLTRGIQPDESVWGEGEANSGTLTFPRPEAGDVVLFQFPTYPLVRIPLKSGSPASIATDADLPPSVAPRPTPTAAPTPTPLTGDALALQQAREVLVSLTKALVERNQEAYLAAFTPELHEAQAELIERIGALPLEAVNFEPSADEQVIVSNNGTEIDQYPVELTYRVRDVDPENVFSSTLNYSLVQRDGRWQITDITGQLPFWTYGPTMAVRSGSFWIFYRPELAAELPTIEREAQQAFELVDRELPNRAASVNVMHVTATEQEFMDLTERSGSRFLGVASARFRIKKAGIRVNSQAFFINGAAFSSDPEQNRQLTIAHELTHLVLSPKTMPYTPAWVSEGAAMYVTDDLPEREIREWYREQGPDSMSLAELSGKTSFGQFDHTGEQTSIDYAYSAYLTKYLVDTYGEDTFWAFYDSYADVPFETISDELPRFGGSTVLDATMGNLAQTLTPDKVEDAFDVDLAMLERDFETWIGQQIE